MRWSSFAAIFACCVALSAPAVAEGEAARPRAVSLHEALALGAAVGPGVAVSEAPRRSVQALARHSSALVRPPLLTLGGGYRSGAVSPGPELSVGLSQEVPLKGVGSARSQLATSYARSVAADVQRARVDGAARAGFAWVDALLAQEMHALRLQGLRQAESILSVTLRRVEVGVALPSELALARGEAGAARTWLYDAEGLQVEALAELRFAIGAPATLALQAEGRLYESDDRVPDERRALAASRAHHPNVQLAASRATQAAHETRLTGALLGPHLSLGASYAREGSGERVLLGFIGIPIPIVDAAAFETTRQEANQRTAESQVELSRAEAAKEIRLALHERRHWREVRDSLRSGALAAFDEAYRIASQQYEVGTSEIASVMLARQRLLGAQEQLAEVAARVLRADIALARATGELLEEGK
jgi:outer membrane protein, heavy metal efflux system